MKIKSIRVSNILSFEHKDLIEDCQKIIFDNDLNVLIGPNGSGKSNLLEILNKIFKQVLFVPCKFNEEQKHLNEVDNRLYPLNRTIDLIQIPPINLFRNKKFPDKPMKIQIEIELTQNDKSNLQFIQNNIQELESLSKEYSIHTPLSSMDVSAVDISSLTFVTFDIIEVGQMLQVSDITIQPDRLAFLYLRWFNFIQKLIAIGILWKSKNWNFLKNSFAILSHNSNYDVIGDTYSIASSGLTETKSRKYENIISRLSEENIRFSRNGEPLVFELVKHIFAYEHKKLQAKYGEKVKEYLSKNEMFQGINEYLWYLLKIRYDVDEDPTSTNYNFSFRDSSNQKITNYEFSSGVKATIHFIFSLFGFELYNGMFIVDEPELHLHPQMQEKYLTMLLGMKKKYDIQIILATHSPIFVNASTVDGMRRFYLNDDGFTHVTIPNITTRERDFVRFLNYRGASKILFVKKVVLVEGDSDEYFFRFFFDKYKETMKITDNLEFTHIVGKEYFKDWKQFLEDDCKIIVCFIRDLDDFGGGSQGIIKKYKERTFILQKGKLENYIGKNKSNKLENVIDFCDNRYEEWKTNQENQDKIRELEDIFNMIMS